MNNLEIKDFKVGDKFKLHNYQHTKNGSNESLYEGMTGTVTKIEDDSWFDFTWEGQQDGRTVFSNARGRGVNRILVIDDIYKIENNTEKIITDELTQVTALEKKKTMPRGRKKKEEATTTTPIADRMVMLLGEVDQQVSQRIDETVGTALDDMLADIEKAKEEIGLTKKLEIIIDDKSNVLSGLQHKNFEMLLKVAQLRLNALLVGMAGTGKTHAGSQVAEALGLPFYTMSVGAQTSKSDIIGYMSATGDYVKTHFRDAYEKGGIFLMDEIDAGNANVLIQVNSALSNGLLAFPDAMVKRHPDFVFIASANTYGTGMSRQYVGRNQLDAATLDRFTIINWDVDENLETSLAAGNVAWYKTVLTARNYLANHNIKALVTPRAVQKGAMLLANNFSVQEVIPAVILGSVPEDKQEDLSNLCIAEYENWQ